MGNQLFLLSCCWIDYRGQMPIQPPWQVVLKRQPGELNEILPNALQILSTAFGSATFPTVIWLYIEQLMAVHSQWLYWIWYKVKKVTCTSIWPCKVQSMKAMSHILYDAPYSIRYQHLQANEGVFLMKNIVYCTAFNGNV